MRGGVTGQRQDLVETLQQATGQQRLVAHRGPVVARR